ncbi:DHH family phosphoesterase [Aliidiomarina soli]|uniref:Acetyltransferase n=1 Tax=Aliidiomarina soli TaxID=1928574 RepID=A0A432WFB9_9GAMM|nr:DHH family phosphoesterase [Aliidiomarina soli]RUO32468.1 acetyltransferase [Aliidiomarina soli]
MVIDIFNGDADGIFALLQWRKAHPLPEQADTHMLVTGVKRDHALLQQVSANDLATAELNLFDLPFDKNSQALQACIEEVAAVFYCDHHHSEQLFTHPKLHTLIETGASVCTGLLVDRLLQGQHRLWALAAAYGDNLDTVATQLAIEQGLSPAQQNQLQRLGWLVNYNSYGAQMSDLHLSPADLYQQLCNYDSPFAVIDDNSSAYQLLDQGFTDDMARAEQTQPGLSTSHTMLVDLGGEPWGRRISGSFANLLARRHPDKAIVVATQNPYSERQGESLTISLRAPQHHLSGANQLCSAFNGGGRAGAGGVNDLPAAQLDNFVRQVGDYYGNYQL